MIKTIIEQEQRRLREKGFDCEIQTLSIPVSSTLQQLYLGNDVYILTGIHLSDEDAMTDLNTVVLSSPVEQLAITQQRMSALGTSIVKVFRQRINIVSFAQNTDIVKYTKSNEETWQVEHIIDYFRNGALQTFARLYEAKPMTVGGVTRYRAGSVYYIDYSLFRDTVYRFITYQQYLNSHTNQKDFIPACTEEEFNKYRMSYERFGYSIISKLVKHSLSELTAEQQDILFSYMQYATGSIVEQDISPYQLEFIRLVPISKQ